MTGFELKFNDGPDHWEHNWLVFKDGAFVAGFQGSNAAERWIAVEREIEKVARRQIDILNRIERL